MSKKSTTKSKQVSFTAKKTVSKPTVVSFNTKQGRVSFTANKRVQKPVKVSFKAKK
jgi:hypothetical protein